MREYDFTLKFDLKNSQTDPSSYIEKLYEGGCDDALIGVGRKGYIALNFLREASSAYEAVSSAISDVKNVIPHCTLVEAGPDFVSLTDVAKILECSRQNIRKLVVNSNPNAPIPVYTGTPSIWHLTEILIWLRDNKSYTIDDELIEMAKTNMVINIARDWQKIEPNVQKDFQALVVS